FANAHDDSAAREAAAIDGVVPSLVVAPASTDETAAVVAFAAGERLAIVPRGSGAALEQGAPAERVDLVLDLSRLDRIVEYNPDDLTISVEAGVTAGALAATLGPPGQLLPIDPPGGGARTLGGLVATNASGPLRARYGTMRDLLLGVRFVQADGVVTWGGARVVKSVTGYDVPKLLVGALGTLGILGELTLRLHPLPEAEATCLLPLRSTEIAQDVVARLVDSPLQPSRCELLDAAALAGDAGVTITGCAPLGLLRVALRQDEPAVLAKAIERLRAFVDESDGSVVVERGSTALRTSLDPWGPVPAGPLALMRALKQEFDPRGTLNPGRFVGGL